MGKREKTLVNVYLYKVLEKCLKLSGYDLFARKVSYSPQRILLLRFLLQLK